MSVSLARTLAVMTRPWVTSKASSTGVGASLTDVTEMLRRDCEVSEPSVVV